MVCGVGFGATATYEAQHERLLRDGLRGLSPLVIPVVMPSSVWSARMTSAASAVFG